MSKSNTKNNYIKNTFSDIFLLYKNIIHWNISKLIIFIWSIILWFLSIIPLVIIFFIYSFFSDVNVNMLLLWMFKWELLPSFFWNSILVLIIAVYFVIFSYSNILLVNLNNSYINWEKISYKINKYFDFKKIFDFFKLSILNFLILLVPILIFIFLVLILFFVSWSIENVLSLVSSWVFNYFTILSFSFFIISLLSLIYLYYRIIFSYFIFSDNHYEYKNSKILFCIRKSFNKTKKIKWFFKFISLVIIFFILSLPIKYFWAVLNNNVKMLKDFSLYKNLTEEQKTKISSKDLYYFEWLWIQFKWLTKEKIQYELNKNNVFVVLFSIFNFLFLYWLFVMLHTSFYRNEIIKEKNEIN